MEPYIAVRSSVNNIALFPVYLRRIVLFVKLCGNKK